jgi:signal transduction histidine kinase
VRSIRKCTCSGKQFTSDGSVDVRLVAESEAVEVSVADTGIGIPRAQLQAIFEAFRQVDGSTTRRFNGVGLGLYIAQHFARMLGGRISVESEEQRGSTFRLWLPLENRSRSVGSVGGPGPKLIAAVAA